MRKEVRIGAAVGVVLIAVVVVSAIVSSRGKDKNKQSVVLDTVKTSPAGGSTSGGADRFPAPVDTGGPAHVDASPDAVATPAPRVDDVPAPVPPRGATNWGALLSADHVEDVAPLTRSRTPEPAVVVEPTPPVLADAGLAAHAIPAAPAPALAPKAESNTPAPAGNSPALSTGGEKSNPPAANAQSHRIESGDTFASIARTVYGDARYYKEIVKANPTIDPKHLRPGMVITLPDPAQFKKDTKKAESAPTAEPTQPAASKDKELPAIDPKTQYRVQSTDSLFRISNKLYHNANKVDAIYQLNKEAIGSDPAKLKLNMVLKLPAPPVQPNAPVRVD